MRRVVLACLLSCPLFVAAPAPAASTTIVVSEFRARGPNGANDEFIEIFNVSNAAVNISGYKIMASDGLGNTALVKQIAAATVLQARHFYLLANNGTQGYSGSITPNATYAQAVPDDGGIAILTAGNSVVDQVGMSAGSAYLEGTPLDPLTTNVNQSYERNNGGCAATKDTDNNSIDFRLNATQSFPQNTGTNCNTCVGVTCVSPPNGQCWTSPGTCALGSCTYPQHTVGSTCSDGDACTVGDACDAAGTCVSGSTATCISPPAPFCSDPQTLVTPTGPGTCSVVSGCSYPQTSQPCTFGCNGTTKACNPDPCSSVSCTTPPSNGCYSPTGTCSNGTCIYTPLPRNTPCSDGDACTTGDVCDAAGSCLVGTPAPTDDGNPCTVDACNTTTGAVTHVAAPDGTDCDDGDKCNGVAACQAGTCTNGAAVSCNTPPIGGCYASSGSCNKGTGACTYAPLTPGATCDDGDACTTADACDGNGACGGSTLGCTASSSCLDQNTSRHLFGGACLSGAGTCSFSHADEACQFGCNGGTGLCDSDPCATVVCNSPPDPCHVGVCSGGACSYVLKAVGTACDDGDPCTNGDECSGGGACAGTALLCTASPAPSCTDVTTSRTHVALGACVTGTCDYGAPVDTTCAFDCNPSTGLCNADPCATTTCDQPPDQCHVGTCSSGVCSYATEKPDSSTCDDGNPCTVLDSCTAGVCVGEPKACNSPPSPTCTDSNTSRTYDASTTCNALLGECGTYPSHDTACTAGCDAATGLCNNDPCAGMTCATPPGSCYLGTGSCTAGLCSYGFVGAGVSCDDGDPCTANDECDGAGKCLGSAACGQDAGVGGAGGLSGSGGTVSVDASTGPDASTGAGGRAGPDASTGGAVGSGGTAPDGGVSSGGATSAAGATSAGTGGSAGSASSGTGGGTPGLDGGANDAALGPVAKHGDNGGCGCSVPGQTATAPWSLAFAAVGLLAARRRKIRR